jgi:hypothetical protein
MEDFLTRPREESNMIEPIRPKLTRFKYAAMLAGAMAVAAFPHAGLTAVASAQKVLDMETLQTCEDGVKADLAKGVLHIWDVHFAYVTCCEYAGGTWNDTTGDCDAPPGDSHGTRQFPGNILVPSDIATEPVTKTPPRPIQVPSDIATVSTVS